MGGAGPATGLGGSERLGQERSLIRGRLELVSCNLDLVTVGIAKVDRVRNLMVLKIERDRAFLQLILGTQKIFAIGAKGKMKRSHRGTIAGGRSVLFVRWK